MGDDTSVLHQEHFLLGPIIHSVMKFISVLFYVTLRHYIVSWQKNTIFVHVYVKGHKV